MNVNDTKVWNTASVHLEDLCLRPEDSIVTSDGSLVWTRGDRDLVLPSRLPHRLGTLMAAGSASATYEGRIREMASYLLPSDRCLVVLLEDREDELYVEAWICDDVLAANLNINAQLKTWIDLDSGGTCTSPEAHLVVSERTLALRVIKDPTRAVQYFVSEPDNELIRPRGADLYDAA